ncbi:MAG TPA: FtsX-like permease family protein [Puia sp.]|jgi:ABC-type antimicrobial peptide transport system permease subunit
MLKNYFKIAWRNLFRNKGFATTNLLGLAIGMTCSILIFLWVHDELSFDKFHQNYNSIYQVVANRDFKNQVFTDWNMTFPLGPALEKGYPQIKTAVATTHQQERVLEYGNTRLKKKGYTVSGHFFDLFTWKFIKGNPATAIADPSSIVLSASAAKTYFGNEEAVNKIMKIDNNQSVKVSAVVADAPGNSSLSFDFIQPFNYSDTLVKAQMNEWYNSSWDVYVQTAPGASKASVEKIINDLKTEHASKDKISTYFLFPMSKWRLYSDFKDGKNIGGMIENVRLFTAIAIIILLIACINFMNLSTARSEKRAKEVGIRKTLGSDKRQLRWQFLFESIILTLISFVIALAAVYLLLPSFNLLVGKHLVLRLSDPVFWTGLLIIILFTGIVAGSYPAFYLSSFNPVKVLKGTFIAGKKAILPRRVLVVSQFVISILLISATIIVYRQLDFIKHRDMGYNPDNLISLPATDDLNKNFPAFKNDLLATGLVEATTRTMSPITEIWWRSPSPDWEGKPAGVNIIFSGQTADVDYVRTMGVRMLEGHSFTGTPADSGNMLLNKAAVDAMHLTHPVGALLRYGSNKYTVIGVTDNVVMETPYKPVDPQMIYYQPGNLNVISVRLKKGIPPQDGIAAMGTLVKKYDPAAFFDYHFVNQEFEKKFLTEKLISRITNIFAGLAIFICCLGLAGLASFTMERRVREFGIRKVLGASVGQLLGLISQEFLRLVTIAFVIAVPLTWWAMSSWLDKYTFRVPISPWTFVAVGLMLLALTLLVVGLNTIRSAMRNPVKSLRSE